MAQPKNIEVRDSGLGLIITRKWFKFNSIKGELLIVLFWGGILVYGLVHIYINLPEEGGLSSIDLGCLLLWVAFLGVFIYLIVVEIINKTEIKADFNKISITHGPLYSFRRDFVGGNKEVFVRDITSLYTQEFVWSKSKKIDQDAPKLIFYDVCFFTPTGEQQKLLSGLPTLEEADYVKTIIKEYLKLKD